MRNSVGEYDGKVALVAGGASGIGRAAVDLLAERGARVSFCDLRTDDVDRVSHHPLVEGRVADVTDSAAVQAFVQHTVDTLGRLDIVVTAAGIQRYGTASSTSESTWDEVFAANVKGCFLVVKHALPHLRASAGSIVLVSSAQAFVAVNDSAAYVASKGAINAFARSIAIDEAHNGVRANVVCPGSVDTAMLRASARQFSDGTDEGERLLVEQWGKLHPLGRVAQASEVAEAIAFLASDRASFITGAALPVDGGLIASVAVSVTAS